MDIFPTAALGALSAIPNVFGWAAAAIGFVAAQLFRVLAFIVGWLSAVAGATAGFFGSIITWPFRLGSSVVLTILSPVIYTLSYVIAPFVWLACLIPRLEPLYIFLGSAAFIGILAGVSTKLTSDVFASALSMNKSDEDEDDERAGRRRTRDLERRRASSASTANSSSLHSSSAALVKRVSDDDYFGSAGAFGGPEIDWQVIDRHERGPNSEHMRRMPLLQSIILEEEEDDSSQGGY